MPVPLAALGTVDLCVLVFCSLFAIRGAFKGFVWQALRTLGLVAGLWLAGMFHVEVGAWMTQRIGVLPDAWGSVAGWLAVVVGVWLVVAMLAWMARGAVRTVDLTSADRVLGFALGGVMGLAFATVGFVIFGRVASETVLKETLENSKSAQYMTRVLDVVVVLVPPEIGERYSTTLDTIREAGGQLQDAIPDIPVLPEQPELPGSG